MQSSLLLSLRFRDIGMCQPVYSLRQLCEKAYNVFTGGVSRFLAGFCGANSGALHQEPVGLRMIRLQWWESGPYFTAFSLHIPGMRNFFNVHEIVKFCPRSRWIQIELVFHYRPPKSDRLLAEWSGVSVGELLRS